MDQPPELLPPLTFQVPPIHDASDPLVRRLADKLGPHVQAQVHADWDELVASFRLAGPLTWVLRRTYIRDHFCAALPRWLESGVAGVIKSTGI